MSSQPTWSPGCHLIGADKLKTGGAETLCETIQSAAAKRGLSGKYSVEIVVLSRSNISARVQLDDGRTLPEQRLASADRPIGRSSLDRFGEAVVTRIAEAMDR